MTVDEQVSAAGEALAAAVGDGTLDPDILECEAGELDAAAMELAMRPGELWAQAAARRTLAAALRARSAALGVMAAADSAVGRAETAHQATAGPEAEAVKRAIEARQQFEHARDALVQARDSALPVSAIADLDTRATSAARVDSWESEKAVEAQQARAAAYQQVLQARRARAEAMAALDVAQAGVDRPADADLSPGERFRALAFAWPYRVLSAENGLTPALSKAERDTCRLLAEMMADLLNASPPGAAQRVRASTAREVRADMAKMVGLSLAGGPPAGAGAGRALAKAR